MREIKDYLHLYLGCEIETNIQGQYVHPYGNVELCELTHENLHRILDTLERDARNKETWDEDSNHYCKPILRPLSDMTDSEKTEIDEQYALFKKATAYNDCGIVMWAARHTQFLLSKGFDLFGLIESELAIDKTKMEVVK